MEKRNKDTSIEVEHTKLDDLLLDIHKRQQQTVAETAESLGENSKKHNKERQWVEETQRSSKVCLSETQKRMSNSDDDFD